MTDKITKKIFEAMAQQTDDPFLYIMATIKLGFNKLSDKRDIVKAWNKFHKDKRLPLPR